MPEQVRQRDQRKKRSFVDDAPERLSFFAQRRLMAKPRASDLGEPFQ
jgi:hypothetical protein